MEEKKSRSTVFPLGKINTIMKSSSDHEHATKESIVLVAKATELFIQKLAPECYKAKNGNKLDYDHIMEVVHATPKYKFLKDIVPKKITVLEFKKIMARKEEERRRKEAENTSSDDDTSDSSGSDESSSASEEDVAPASPEQISDIR
ncbi:unnamed protein product [Ceutorhynchus assimilis]|uniref:Transcription factor CBF/NF-Y/archaeal histone domain-containing protein n=1 Tax=Ceutorhynchus assimilis TaxID=467358 RepID=A0A9N9ME25_9CUCU|nr:unnamed protein product [Ceutorhynchus assimilis]